MLLRCLIIIYTRDIDFTFLANIVIPPVYKKQRCYIRTPRIPGVYSCLELLLHGDVVDLPGAYV